MRSTVQAMPHVSRTNALPVSNRSAHRSVGNRTRVEHLAMTSGALDQHGSPVLQRMNRPAWGSQALATLVQNIRESAGDILWDWTHIKGRHVISGGMEEGQVAEVADAHRSYFSTDDQSDIYDDLVVRTIKSGKVFSGQDNNLEFVLDFGAIRVGGYEDGSNATKVRVVVKIDSMTDSNDTGSAIVATAFPFK